MALALQCNSRLRRHMVASFSTTCIRCKSVVRGDHVAEVVTDTERTAPLNRPDVPSLISWGLVFVGGLILYVLVFATLC